MMTLQICLVLLLVLNDLQTFSAAEVEDDSDSHPVWESFKNTHQKSYEAEEEEMRKKHFEENYRTISEHNRKYDQGKSSFFLGINKFADMPVEEFRSIMTVQPLESEVSEDAEPIPFVLPDCPVPDAVDWRKESAVTPVKDQGHCGSCYAFVTTGALEGQNAIKGGKLVSLSEQNILDCKNKKGNNGCRGGYVDRSLTYIKENGGIDSEESYPYEGEVNSCRYEPKNSASQCSGYSNLPRGNETVLQIATACIGPISIYMDARPITFQFYEGGIYDDPRCSKKIFNHAMLVVGYGSEDGKDYWLVKNSWGTSWGIDGYIKMARNINQCNIAAAPKYPVL